jgi:DNA polymerase III epsilon subunit-like protein
MYTEVRKEGFKMKIDKRAKYYVILDTETTASCSPEENIEKKVMEKLVYDLGYTIANKKEIVLKRNYLVKEIFENEELMNNAYFASKKPIYDKMVAEKKVEIKPFAEIIKILQNDIKETRAEVFGAYNVGFDLDAIMQTTNFIFPKIFKMFFKKTSNGNFAPDTVKFCQTYVFRKDLEIIDLWTMACQTLCSQVTYQTYYLQETEKGNIKSNAEIVYNYIEDLNGDFEEEHTALSDSIIETKILQRMLRLHKKLDTKFQFMPFRLIERKVA